MIPRVKVPKIYWGGLTTRRVLTMEWIDGVKLTDTKAMAARNLDIIDFVDVGIECSLRQLLAENGGFFHADPHPGMSLVHPFQWHHLKLTATGPVFDIALLWPLATWLITTPWANPKWNDLFACYQCESEYCKRLVVPDTDCTWLYLVIVLGFSICNPANCKDWRIVSLPSTQICASCIIQSLILPRMKAC